MKIVQRDFLETPWPSDDMDDGLAGNGPASAEYLAPASEIPIDPATINEFLERTPELSASEQATLLGAAIEGDTAGAERFNFSRFMQGFQRGLSAFQTGAQMVGGLTAAFGGNNRTARNFARWANRLGQGAGAVGGMLRSFRGGRVPALPRAQQPRPTPARPTQLRPTQPRPMQRRPVQPRGGVRPPQPGRTPSRRPTAAPPKGRQRGSLNATALMSLLMSNPRLLQTQRLAAFMQSGVMPRLEVELPGSAPVAIELGAIMNMFAHLARESMRELNALESSEAGEVPSYLLGENGEYLVDPADSEARAALVLEYIRLQAEVERYELDGGAEETGETDDEAELAEHWAAAAGFFA